jgi:flagellar hook-length control protein FliK
VPSRETSSSNQPTEARRSSTAGIPTTPANEHHAREEAPATNRTPAVNSTATPTHPPATEDPGKRIGSSLPQSPPESTTAGLAKPVTIPPLNELEPGIARAPGARFPEPLVLRLTSAFEAQLAAKAREFLERGETRLRVQLDPPSLGRLRIELDLSETRATARIFTANPEAAALLARDRGELVRAFTQQGILDVTVHVEAESRPSRGWAGGDRSELEHFADWDLNEDDVADASPPRAAPHGRLDLFI